MLPPTSGHWELLLSFMTTLYMSSTQSIGMMSYTCPDGNGRGRHCSSNGQEQNKFIKLALIETIRDGQTQHSPIRDQIMMRLSFFPLKFKAWPGSGSFLL